MDTPAGDSHDPCYQLAALVNRRTTLGGGAYAFPPIGGLDQPVLFGLLAHERRADTLGQMSAHRLSNGADRQWRRRISSTATCPGWTPTSPRVTALLV